MSASAVTEDPAANARVSPEADDGGWTVVTLNPTAVSEATAAEDGVVDWPGTEMDSKKKKRFIRSFQGVGLKEGYTRTKQIPTVNLFTKLLYTHEEPKG